MGIWSTYPEGTYISMSGTSMAAPHATGAIALYASTHPTESANQVRSAILSAVKPTISLFGKTVTGGRLNIGTIVLPPTGVTNLAARLRSPRIEGSQFQVAVDGATNQAYGIEFSTDLTTWVPLTTVTNISGTLNFSDSISSAWPKKFYRAVAR